MPQNGLKDVVEETQLLLKENSKWKELYAGYAKGILSKLVLIRSIRSTFREWSPLKLYLTTTNAKSAKNSVTFELRYMGQTAAILKAHKNNQHIISTKGYDVTNQRDFECNIELENDNWHGEKAREFRSFFKWRRGPRKTGGRKRNNEHRLESLLLSEFSKTRRKDKALLNIQPLKIGGARFAMPTPISASDHKEIKLGRNKGGGIDILARTGIGGRATYLCIMELKDENNKSEPPQDAIKQALAYTTFIRELLRSGSGCVWWKLFGFSGNIPRPLTLYAACVMPSNINNDYSFRGETLEIDGDLIKLHYLYFTTEDDGKISIKADDTSLSLASK
jgi:hypothetical protein